MQKYLEETLTFAGCAAVTYGVAQIYPPAAWIIGGFFAIAGAYLHGKANQPVRTYTTAAGNESGGQE